jgi:hypothetical protein
MLLGATGLVGRECLRLLLADPGVTRIVALTRRPLDDQALWPKLQVEVVDFEQLASRGELFGVDQIFCALGTTIKKAGSRDAFRRVDFIYPLTAAKLGAERGARHFLLVSSLGASAESRFFYNRVKGQLEDALRTLPYPSVTIVRPSLLVGTREEFRLGEKLAKVHIGVFCCIPRVAVRETLNSCPVLNIWESQLCPVQIIRTQTHDKLIIELGAKLWIADFTDVVHPRKLSLVIIFAILVIQARQKVWKVCKR